MITKEQALDILNTFSKDEESRIHDKDDYYCDIKPIINEMGIEKFLNNNYAKAIIQCFTKDVYYDFIECVNNYYLELRRNNEDKIPEAMEVMRNPEVADSIFNRKSDKQDFITYSISFFQDPNIIVNFISSAAKQNDKGIDSAVVRGISGMKPNITGLTNAKYERKVYPYVALTSQLERGVEMDFELKILGGILDNVENPEQLKSYANAVKEKMDLNNAKAKKESYGRVKEQIEVLKESKKIDDDPIITGRNERSF